jgi:hypothetical protein
MMDLPWWVYGGLGVVLGCAREYMGRVTRSEEW